MIPAATNSWKASRCRSRTGIFQPLTRNRRVATADSESVIVSGIRHLRRYLNAGRERGECRLPHPLARGATTNEAVNGEVGFILRLICSVHGYTTRRPANTSCPRSGRFRLRELRVSRHFTAHLFSPWIPSSARRLDGGPLAPLSGNPSGEVACWYKSPHNPKVWSLADLPSDEHRTCSTPAWWHRI